MIKGIIVESRVKAFEWCQDFRPDTYLLRQVVRPDDKGKGLDTNFTNYANFKDIEVYRSKAKAKALNRKGHRENKGI